MLERKTARKIIMNSIKNDLKELEKNREMSDFIRGSIFTRAIMLSTTEIITNESYRRLDNLLTKKVYELIFK